MFNSSHLRLHYAKIMNWKTDEGDYKLGRSEVMADPTEIEYWWESLLDHFNFGERMIFLVIFCFIVAFGVIGNILTLYVVIER